MPPDPRKAIGICSKLGASDTPFDGTFQSWQTGGSPSATPATANIASFPPTSIAGVQGNAAQLPLYTPTKSLISLPPPTFSPTPTPTRSGSASVSVGNGWFDKGDTSSLVTTIPGCVYPDAWSAVSSAVPTGCGGVDVGGGAGVVTTPTAIVTPTPTLIQTGLGAGVSTASVGASTDSGAAAAVTTVPVRR